MNSSNSKMIRVTSRGFVTTSRGRVIAPIMSPYRETYDRIWNMITADRADVEEKLPNGEFIKLNTQNFDKVNFVTKETKAPVPNKVNTVTEKSKTWDAPEVQEVPKEVEVKEVETSVESTTEEADSNNEQVEETPVDTKVEEEKVQRPLTPSEIRRNRKNKNKKNGFNQPEENSNNVVDSTDVQTEETPTEEGDTKSNDADLAVDIETVE